MKKLVAGAIVSLGAAFAVPVALASEAQAYPQCNPYNVKTQQSGGFIGYGGFCDEFPVKSGQHFHCEWGGAFGGISSNCGWRWEDNTEAPPPASR